VSTSISLLLPTYMRHDELVHALDSVERTISKPCELEIVAHCIYDDLIALEILEERTDRIILSERVGYKTLPASINAMADVAAGDWLFPFADDVVCETQGWDDVIREYDTKQPTLLVCSERGRWFPVISRAAYQAMGCVTQSQFYDEWLWAVFMRGAPLRMFRDVPVKFTNKLVCKDKIEGLSIQERCAYDDSVSEAAQRLSEWRG